VKFKNKLEVMLAILLLIVSAYFGFNSISNNIEKDYELYLQGEKVESLIICEDEWHYDLIDSFIPCVINSTIGGISNINWSASPQLNCQSLGGFFPGLNLNNESRAKELYDKIMPKCFTLSKEEITDEWINSTCFCEENNSKECIEYDCGGELLVKVDDIQ